MQPHHGRPLEPASFFEVSKAFPLGIVSEGAEDVVRDPISVGPAGELVCVGEVPENTVLNLLCGDPASLIDAAREAAHAALCWDGAPVRAALLVDCISRTLFLEDAFDDELRAVASWSDVGEAPEFLGALTLGEISSCGDGLLEFFNKTIVAGAFRA